MDKGPLKALKESKFRIDHLRTLTGYPDNIVIEADWNLQPQHPHLRRSPLLPTAPSSLSPIRTNSPPPHQLPHWAAGCNPVRRTHTFGQDSTTFNPEGVSRWQPAQSSTPPWETS